MYISRTVSQAHYAVNITHLKKYLMNVKLREVKTTFVYNRCANLINKEDKSSYKQNLRELHELKKERNGCVDRSIVIVFYFACNTCHVNPHLPKMSQSKIGHNPKYCRLDDYSDVVSCQAHWQS